MKKILIALLLFALPSVSIAETDNDYIVNDIRVQEAEKDATTARRNAINRGQREALNIVLDRQGIDPSNSVIISDNEISQTIRSMQIKNERITTSSYSAILSFEFSSDFLRHTLRKYDISRASQRLESYLIVPLVNENGQSFLWDKGNRWLASFSKNLRGVNNIFVANNNFSSQNQVKENFFENPNFSRFKNIANTYSVNNVVVVVSNYTKGSDIMDIRLYVMNTDNAKAAALRYSVVNQQNLNSEYDKAAIIIIDYIKGLVEKSVEVVSSQNQGTLGKNEINIYVPISSLSEFHKASNLIRNNRNIVESRLKSLSKKLAVFSVKYSNNDLDSFAQSLRNNGIVVSERKEGIYILI